MSAPQPPPGFGLPRLTRDQEMAVHSAVAKVLHCWEWPPPGREPNVYELHTRQFLTHRVQVDPAFRSSVDMLASRLIAELNNPIELPDAPTEEAARH